MCQHEFTLGAVHKRRPKSGWEGFVQCGHFVGKDLQMRTSAPLVQESLDFSKIMMHPHGQEGEGGEGVNFSRFCADDFYSGYQ